MKIKSLKNYYDKQLEKNVCTGDVYEVSEERAQQIIEVGFAMPLPVEEKKQEEEKEEKIVKKEKATRSKKK